MVQSASAQADTSGDPTSKRNLSQKRANGVTQGIGLEFKPQHHIKNK
jgi:hypothetical protein